MCVGFSVFYGDLYPFASIIVVSPSLLILMFWIYPSTAYCSPFCLVLEDIAEILLQKESLTLTDRCCALTSSKDVATVTKGAGLLQTFNSALTCARTTDSPNLLAVCVLPLVSSLS